MSSILTLSICIINTTFACILLGNITFHFIFYIKTPLNYYVLSFIVWYINKNKCTTTCNYGWNYFLAQIVFYKHLYIIMQSSRLFVIIFRKHIRVELKCSGVFTICTKYIDRILRVELKIVSILGTHFSSNLDKISDGFFMQRHFSISKLEMTA
jgi:hypothetical protein